MTEGTMPCYGLYKRGEEACLACDLADWCKDAGDPPLIGVRDRSDDCLAEGPADDVEDDSGRPLEDDEPEDFDAAVRREAADALRSAMVLLAEACDGNPKRLMVCVLRSSGLTFSEVGARMGMSKQGVDKHLRQIEERNPSLAVALRYTQIYDEYITTRTLRLDKLTRDAEFAVRRAGSEKALSAEYRSALQAASRLQKRRRGKARRDTGEVIAGSLHDIAELSRRAELAMEAST